MALEGIESAHSAISLRSTTFRVYFHDSPEGIIPSYLLPNAIHNIPRAPIKQLAFFPQASTSGQTTTALFPNSPNLPIWSPNDVLHIIDHFSSIGSRDDDRTDLPAYLTFNDTIRLPPTLTCLHHDTTKSTARHHNYWRKRFRHAFTHFEDTARNIGLGADCLQTWYAGKTMVRPRGWGTPRDPTRISPRLVLEDIDSDVLKTQGCLCVGAFTCCVKPERSGCRECPVYSVKGNMASAIATSTNLTGSIGICQTAYEVLLVTAPMRKVPSRKNAKILH